MLARYAIVFLGAVFLGLVIFVVRESLRYTRALGFTLINTLKCGVEECPVRFHEAPVLPRCGGDLTRGLTATTRPFLQSVVNFQAAFIASTLTKTSLVLRGMTILETFQLPGDEAPLAVLAAIDASAPERHAEGSQRGAAILALRGTQTLPDVSDDARLYQVDFEFGGQIHAGFSEVYLQIKDAVLDSLRKHSFSEIIVCGHSLGGAVAALLTVALATASDAPLIDLICFATPRVGDEAFCTVLSRSARAHVRVQNSADVVPQLPAAVTANLKTPHRPYFYFQAGRLVEFQSNWLSSANNHNIANYWTFLHEDED